MAVGGVYEIDMQRVIMVGDTGLEPVTSCMSSGKSRVGKSEIYQNSRF